MTIPSTQQHMDALSRIVFRGYSDDFASLMKNLEIDLFRTLNTSPQLTDDGRSSFLRLADMHHVTVRALQVLEKSATRFGNESNCVIGVDTRFIEGTISHSPCGQNLLLPSAGPRDSGRKGHSHQISRSLA